MNLTHFLIAGCLIIVLLVTSGCTGSSPRMGAAPSASLFTTSTNSTVQLVEMYHFHGDHQCVSCIAVGDLAEKTVNENFRDELASGRLVFAHVNYDVPENTVLATKYNVTGSSLWIGVYDNNGFHKQQNMDVWYLTDDKEAYEVYLSGIISRRLNGDLS